MAKNKKKKKSITRKPKQDNKPAVEQKRILVTGGLGFIGHKVVEQLQKQNHRVEVIDVLTTYGLLDKDELEYLYNERLAKFREDTIIHKIDVAEIELVNDIFLKLKPDYVVHLASFPNEKLASENPVEAAHTMCQGLANILENSARHNIKRFLYVSSSMVLGDFSFPADETVTPNPKGSYAIWKHAGEKLVENFNKQHDLDYVTVRPSAVYGPLDNCNRVVGKFILNALADKKLSVNGEDERLDFTYVDDLAQGIISALLKGKTGIYHLTRGDARKIKEAGALAVKFADKGTVEINDKDTNMPSRGTLNIDKAKTDFNFDPKINIEEGIKLYYEWIRNSVYWSKKTV